MWEKCAFRFTACVSWCMWNLSGEFFVLQSHTRARSRGGLLMGRCQGMNHEMASLGTHRRAKPKRNPCPVKRGITGDNENSVCLAWQWARWQGGLGAEADITHCMCPCYSAETGLEHSSSQPHWFIIDSNLVQCYVLSLHMCIRLNWQARACHNLRGKYIVEF